MTRLPYVLEMDPDEWLKEVKAVAGEARERVEQCLDDHDEVGEAVHALREVFKDYLVDEEDPGDDELWCEQTGVILFVGQKRGGDWLRLDIREQDGAHRWWFRGEEWPEGQSIEEGHREVAERVVEASSWGNEERAMERASIQRAKRAIWEPFLEGLEERGAENATAEELMDLLKALVGACLPAGEEKGLKVVKSQEGATHLMVQRKGLGEQHILAVSPGASRAPERLEELFGMEPILDNGVYVITDHRKFVWQPFLQSKKASSELYLPSEVEEGGDVEWVDYYYAIDRAASLMIGALNPEE